MKFDEEIIAEHDKDRGTRQKIVEPKTPYHEDDQMHDESEGHGNHNEHMEDLTKGGHHTTNTHTIEQEVKKHLEEAERNK